MAETSSTSIRILHVDDEPDLAEIAATFLETEDKRFTVETATNASEGLKQLTSDIDCIVSDYDMPGQNGIAFLKQVRGEYPELPFILYTGKGSEEVASDAISAGVTDYLQKESGTGQYTVLANRIANAVEQSRAQEELEDSQKRLSLFIEQSPLGVIEWNETFEVVQVNDAAEDLLGYTEAELKGRSWEEIIPDSDREAVREVVTNLLDAEGGYHSINENLRKDGTRITCEWHNRIITDETGDTVAIFSQFQDVTDREAREARLRALNETTHRLMAADTRERISEIGVEAASNILGLDANAIHLYDNERAALVPVARTDAAAELVGDIPTFTEGDSIAWRAFHQRETLALDDVQDDPDIYNPETPVRSELHLPLEDHGTMIAGSETSEAFDQQDIVFGEILADAIVVALDQVEQTERLRTRERELTRQNDRLEEFTSVVSHDLRNPLTVIGGRIDLVQEECDSEHLDAIASAHERMETLLDDLLTLARHGETACDVEPVDLATLTENCWQNVATATATLAVDIDQRIGAERSRLQQLLENLMRNAVEHGGEDVTVTVGELDDGFYVEDDGPGIPETERDDVFEPGYSTTEDGTGFGLSIVKQVADAHDWTICVTAGSESGARFEIHGAEIFAE